MPLINKNNISSAITHRKKEYERELFDRILKTANKVAESQSGRTGIVVGSEVAKRLTFVGLSKNEIYDGMIIDKSFGRDVKEGELTVYNNDYFVAVNGRWLKIGSQSFVNCTAPEIDYEDIIATGTYKE